MVVADRDICVFDIQNIIMIYFHGRGHRAEMEGSGHVDFAD